MVQFISELQFRVQCFADYSPELPLLSGVGMCAYSFLLAALSCCFRLGAGGLPFLKPNDIDPFVVAVALVEEVVVGWTAKILFCLPFFLLSVCP